MAKGKKSVVLAKLAQDSRGELKAMVAELSGAKSELEGADAKPVKWGQRFAASGKTKSAPKIRLA
jgi:hypothetical protein